MSSVISAIGLATPRHRFPQHQLYDFMCRAHQLGTDGRLRLKKLYDASGIDYRHSVLPDFGLNSGDFEFFGNGPGLSPFPSTKERMERYRQSASLLASEAISDLSSRITDFDYSSVTHLITVSCTGMYAPGLDIDIQESLGLSAHIERTCINFMGCYGAFNALKVADYICRADTNAKVLVVGVELCTLHFQRESTLPNWLANSLFGDGASAVLVEPAQSRSTAKAFELLCFYNLLVTDAKDQMQWTIGNTGFDMYLSSQIAKNIKSRVREVTDALLQKAEMKLDIVSKLAIHPGGRRILEVCDEVLCFPSDALEHSYEILRQYGNMSSVTVLFVLAKMLDDVSSDAHIMSFAFGPGLTFESMLLKTV
jgi:predicted naringenin-chalcone synthase